MWAKSILYLHEVGLHSTPLLYWCQLPSILRSDVSGSWLLSIIFKVSLSCFVCSSPTPRSIEIERRRTSIYRCLQLFQGFFAHRAPAFCRWSVWVELGTCAKTVGDRFVYFARPGSGSRWNHEFTMLGDRTVHNSTFQDTVPSDEMRSRRKD